MHPALEISFFYFCGSFLPSRIRIQPTKIDAGPDPKQCIKLRKDLILNTGKVTNLRKLVVQVPLATLYMGQKTRWCSVSHIRLNTAVTLLQFYVFGMKLIYCTLLRDAIHSITFHLQSQLVLYYWHEDDSVVYNNFYIVRNAGLDAAKENRHLTAGRSLVEGYSYPKISVFGSVCLSADKSWRVEGMEWMCASGASHLCVHYSLIVSVHKLAAP